MLYCSKIVIRELVDEEQIVTLRIQLFGSVEKYQGKNMLSIAIMHGHTCKLFVQNN